MKLVCNFQVVPKQECIVPCDYMIVFLCVSTFAIFFYKKNTTTYFLFWYDLWILNSKQHTKSDDIWTSNHRDKDSAWNWKMWEVGTLDSFRHRSANTSFFLCLHYYYYFFLTITLFLLLSTNLNSIDINIKIVRTLWPKFKFLLFYLCMWVFKISIYINHNFF